MSPDFVFISPLSPPITFNDKFWPQWKNGQHSRHHVHSIITGKKLLLFREFQGIHGITSKKSPSEFRRITTKNLQKTWDDLMIWWFFGASMVIFPGLQKIAPTFRSTWMNNAARKTACGSKRFGAAFKDGWIHPRWIQGFLLNFFVVAFGRLFMLVFFKHPLKRFKLVDDTELYLYDTTLWIIVLSHVNSLWSYEKPNNNWKNSPTFQRWKCPAPPGHFGWPSAPTIAEICFLNLLVVQ